ncbi:MAG TPA: aspartyl protease family protein [Allosphingosinicella sp.]|jgi:tetratricopeptide (TPR) repeat protein|nr:aspartyl protease family protein [Allosphingosinicella sp.]
MRRYLARAFAGIAAMALAGTAQAACRVEQHGELPVTMNGLSPLVSAKINGVDASFIVDSGAFFSLISPGVAGAAGLKLIKAPPGFWIVGIGGPMDASYATVKDLSVARMTAHNIQFFVAGTDTGTAGLLGQNVLGVGDVEYDLPHGMVRLMRSIGCEHNNLAYWVGPNDSYSLLKIEPRNEDRPHTIGTIIINGKPVRATFDTGAPTTLLSLRAAARAGIKPDSPGVKPSGVAGGLGRGVIRTWVAPIDSIQIGDEVIHHPHIDIADMGADDTDMLIGADFFISHRVYVDNAAHRMFFTYTGGEVFGGKAHGDATAPVAVASAQASDPVDAEGFSRRGAVFAAEHDVPRAIADYGRAIALAPKEPRYLVQRAEAYLRDHKKELALADLDKAIGLDPANLEARLQRAALHVEAKKMEAAVADLDAAAHSAPPTLDEHLEIGGLYEAAHAYAPAVAQLDLWIAAHGEDARFAEALNARCWSRALAGSELKKALDDCNAALRFNPHNPAFLDSRGLVRVRMGDWDKAIGDYDEVLKHAPKTAWSLYGRGVAKHHKGLAADGDSDIKAATAIDADVLEQAKKDGID